MPAATVVIATPIGMHVDTLPGAVMADAVGLFDLAYGPEPTPAVAAAAGGIPVADGIHHLVAQAVRSFRLWTGADVDAAVMEHAARGNHAGS